MAAIDQISDDQFSGIPEVAGVTHRMVDAGGVRLHVAEAGAGPPVLLLHGWPQHWWLWRNAIPSLAESYKVYAPDLRGFGWSDVPKHGYGKFQFAADMFALLDTLGIDEPIRMAGHDWGGWTGFLMAMQEPQRFDRFLALNIAPPWGDPGSFKLGPQLKALSKLAYQLPLSTPGLSRWIQAGGGRKRFADAVKQGTTSRDAWADGSLDVFLDQFKDPRRTDATMQLYRTFVTREVPKIAAGKYVSGRLTVPTRMLFGADDVAVSRSMIEADHSKMADNLTAEIVEDCGHFIVDEQPQLVTDRMLDWFAGSSEAL